MVLAWEVPRTSPALGAVFRILICLLALATGNASAAKGGVGGGGAGGGGAFAPAPMLAAAPVPAQFDITGFIQEATLDSAGTICRAGDPRLAGGTLRVNDTVVIVPCNTVLQMPAATLAWQELFSLAPRDIGLPLGANGIPSQTGLALTDTVTMPLATKYSNGRLPSYEAHVQGNIVDGRYIAGLIFLSQQNLNIGQGTITAIDYHNGELLIASSGPNPSSARVKINDPLGRFGLAHGAPGSSAALIEPTYDQRFSVDADSPTIHAATGYPMCIPRSNPFVDGDDPLCPQANRPRSPDCASLPTPFPAFALPAAGQFCRSFVMPPPARGSCTPAPGYSCPPDATQQAPFVVGDFIDFQGTLKFDSKGPYISAHTIVGHIGIYTSPGTMPAYAAIEMELQGTAALPMANLPQESTSRIKIEGFTTDPTSLVDIYAIDVDPLTGATSDRLLGIANPSGPPVVGRFRFLPAAGAFLPPPREFRVVSRTLCGDPSQPCRMPSAPQTYANGLIAGQYHAPNFEFIFPENTILGTAVVPANFQDFVFLFCGSGPLTTPTAGATPPLVGQLDPTPWAAPMPDPMFAWKLCPTARRISATGATAARAPIANATATPTSASAGQLVGLSALASSDPNTPAQPLSFVWTQTGGPAVVLAGANTATPSFSAPNVAAPTTLSFTVVVTNTVPLSAIATVSLSVFPSAVTVTPTVTGAPIAVATATPTSATPGQSVSLSAQGSSDTNTPAQPLTFLWTQTGGPAVTLSGANTASASFSAPNVTVATTLSFSVAVTNTLSLTSIATVSLSVSPPAAPPSLTFFAPTSALAGSVVNMIGTVSDGATFKWTQTTGPLVTLTGADTLTPSFTAPTGPSSITFSLTATSVAGASVSLSRTIAVNADLLAIGSVVWDNRQGKGKLNVVANTNAIFLGSPPAGISMSVKIWNANIAAGAPGSATNPITAPMDLVTNVPGQPPVCLTALPCFTASLVSVIADPGSSTAVRAFVPPTTVTVNSTLGGSATVSGTAIKVR